MIAEQGAVGRPAQHDHRMELSGRPPGFECGRTGFRRLGAIRQTHRVEENIGGHGSAFRGIDGARSFLVDEPAAYSGCGRNFGLALRRPFVDQSKLVRRLSRR